MVNDDRFDLDAVRPAAGIPRIVSLHIRPRRGRSGTEIYRRQREGVAVGA
jgi:hypothetical protein